MTHRAGAALLLTLGLLFVAITVGAGGWWVMRLREEQRATTKRLQETAAQLETKGASLSMLEEEHHRVSDEYDTLKARWAETDQALQQLTQSSAQMRTELATLSNERASLQHKVEEAADKQQALHKQFASLREKVMEEAASRAAAEAELAQVASSSLTLAEAEQLSEAFARQRQEAARLTERMDAMSHEVEQMAFMSSPESDVPAAGGDTHQQALRYRQLGELHLAHYQYPKAAEAFERSLRHEDHPMVHAKLAFIYSRFIPNQQKWAHHAAHAPPGYPAQLALESTASVQGLPRSSSKLLWRWLTE